MSLPQGWFVPRNKEDLRRLVETQFRVVLPELALCPHHDAPLDYLAESFFEQRDLLVWANRGGGKTMLAAIATMLDGVFHAPAKIRVLGGSFDQYDRLADYIRDLLEVCPDLVVGRMTRQKVTLDGGSEIRMLAQSQRAVRGQHVQKIRCDEVDLFDPQVWRAVQFATQSQRGDEDRAGCRGSIEVLSTLHQSGGLMQRLVDDAQRSGGAAGGYKLVRWCLWEVIEQCPPTRRCEGCPLAEDCRGIARRANGYFRIDDAIAIKCRSSRAAWEAEMLCMGVRRDWLVLPEFSPSKHVTQVEYCAEWPLYRAIDFGYRSPLVCLWMQVTPAGAVHVLEEYARSGAPIDHHAAAMLQRDMGPVTATYVDPAGRHKEATSGVACTDILASKGIPCTSCASAISGGLEIIRSALAPAYGEPTLLIHPRCGGLIEAFNAYHFDGPDTGGKSAGGDSPVKDGPDHYIDALRYFFINRMRPGQKTKRGRY